ncbi:MAG: acyloxyacyl hydrolase [Breznakibacter sp.]
MVYQINDHSRGAELKLFWNDYSNNSWRRYFGYPETGISIFYQTFGNKDIYGEGIALYPSVNFRLIGNSNFAVKYKLGLGMAYATKIFDKATNPSNTILSSHLNAFVGLGLSLDARISPHWSTSLGCSLSHLSNGAIRKPNNGVNTALLSLSASYLMAPTSVPVSKRIKPPIQKNRYLLATAAFGSNQTTDFDGKSYKSGTISLAHIWSNKPTHGYGIGIDAMYYGGAPSNDPELDLSDLKTSYAFWDYFYSSIFLAYHLQMDKTTVFFNIGAYIYEKTPATQPIYPRLGIRYELSRNLLAHFGIKASFFRAQYLEFGVGYKIQTKRFSL